jgi:hypothetical protein
MTFNEDASRASAIVRYLWTRRRWAYGAYVLVALLRIPSRVGFRLAVPICDTSLTLKNAGLSMTKVPHIALFAIFFVLTALQFEQLDERTLTRSLLATAALGLLVELEEGATRTGNCRLTDVLPDIAGALIAGAGLLSVMIVRNWVRRASTLSE